MRNKKIKWIVTIVLAVLCVVCVTNIVFADNFNFDAFDAEQNAKANVVTERVMGTGIQVIRIVGTGVSIIMLTYVGIKYMMSAPSEKADFKRSAVLYVLGAILVFAATNILSVIMNFADVNL